MYILSLIKQTNALVIKKLFILKYTKFVMSIVKETSIVNVKMASS